MKKKFMSEFEIIKMSNHSLICQNKSGNKVYIHRNVFNQLDFAEDYRLTSHTYNGKTSIWVEALFWKSI